MGEFELVWVTPGAKCDECDGPIRIGEEVIRGSFGWLHAECPAVTPDNT